MESLRSGNSEVIFNIDCFIPHIATLPLSYFYISGFVAVYYFVIVFVGLCVLYIISVVLILLCNEPLNFECRCARTRISEKYPGNRCRFNQ